MQASLSGHVLYLESYLWRDFMPVSPPEGRPLAAVLRIHATDGPVPRAMSVDSAWLVNGAEVWATAPRRMVDPAGTTGELEMVAREGPRWAPGSAVEVVVRVKAGQQWVFIRAANQRIRRTD